MFKFLFIAFVVLYVLYNVSQTSNSDKKKKNSILDDEGEYVDYEELD